jgi:dihydrolipoamide dehydrogenase
LHSYQVLIVGGGPGGYETAIRLNQYSISCAVIEEQRLGGICLNWGCIPTKALVKSAELYREMSEGEAYGLPNLNAELDYRKVFERKNKTVEQLVGGIEYLFRKRRIPIIAEKAVSIAKEQDGYLVTTDQGTLIQAEYLIIATGSLPKDLPGVKIDEMNILSSTGILGQENLPASLAVVGGGVIGCEFASIMNAFGVQTTIVEFLPRLVSTEDEEVSKRLALALKKTGIKILLGTGVECTESTAGGQLLKLGDGSSLIVDKVLLSVGRTPRNDLIWNGLELESEKGAIRIDAMMRTNLPKVFAIGDVTGKMLLAHTASRQGLMVAELIKAEIEGKIPELAELNYTNIPRCTFTNPEIASVGYTEAEARDIFTDINVGKFPFTASGKALALGNTFGFVKTISRADTGVLVGMHIIGPNAAELIAQGAIMVSQQATAGLVEQVVFAHPTLSEAVKESLEDIRNISIHKI